MAYCSDIINTIDTAIVAASLTDARFQNRAFAGLCYLTPAKIKDGTTAVLVPAKVTSVGECSFIVPDDNFNLISYHRLISNVYSAAPSQFGDGTDYQNCVTDVLLTVIGFTNKLRLTADQIEALFIAGFPNTFTTAFKSSIQLKELTAQVLSSSFDSNAIFNTEYRGETYFLKPETIMFQIRYRIEAVFKKGCFDICCEPEE